MNQLITMIMAAMLVTGLRAETALQENVQQILGAASGTNGSRQAVSDWRPLVSFMLQISGTAGGNAFQSTGRLYLVAGQLPRLEDASLRSDVNPLELMITEDQGRFSFATNTYLLRRTGAMTDANIDLVEMKLNNQTTFSTLEITPVKAYVPWAAGRNSFTTSSDRSGPAYQIVEGSLQVRITANELTGSMELRGMNLATQAMETFAATFTAAPEALGILDPSQSHTIRTLPTDLKR